MAGGCSYTERGDDRSFALRCFQDDLFRMFWAVLLSVLAVFAVVAVVVAVRAPARKAEEERRRRYAIQDTGERIGLAAPRPAAPPPGKIREVERVSRPREADAAGRAGGLGPKADPDDSGIGMIVPGQPVITGRLVNTPDGEMILTTPPFALRETIVTLKQGRYFNALSLRLPAWVILCPRVRLESLVTPTRPDGRDPEDWRTWRRRVRMRSVDMVLVDRRSWKPILAVMFQARVVADAKTIAGGLDRMAEEVLTGVGLPVLRLTGEFEPDWPLIRPYVEQAILPTTSEEQVIEAADRTTRVDQDAAVTLLRMDDDKGWLLE